MAVMEWSYKNPVDIRFGGDALATAAALIGTRAYGLVSYGEAMFDVHSARLASMAGAPTTVVNDVAPNPDCRDLADQCTRFWQAGSGPEVIVALGGGSVIDTAKVLAAAGGGFDRVMAHIETPDAAASLNPLPIIAIPTTAGTGSEVTCWATVWDGARGAKHSLSDPGLYPVSALVDPGLMLDKPPGLTCATGLDALSHALESIWNKNANPVSARHGVFAARTILRDLPRLMEALDDLELRTSLAEAALSAGLAFSNTKTAIAHNLSYPVTLGYGVAHGIACSFTLPTILRSVIGLGGFREQALRDIFGDDLRAGAAHLSEVLTTLGVGQSFAGHGIPSTVTEEIIEAAFLGQRGRNFAGSSKAFLAEARRDGLL